MDDKKVGYINTHKYTGQKTHKENITTLNIFTIIRRWVYRNSKIHGTENKQRKDHNTFKHLMDDKKVGY